MRIQNQLLLEPYLYIQKSLKLFKSILPVKFSQTISHNSSQARSAHLQEGDL